MFCLRAVSSLDEESKWSVHYTAPWHQQENVFLPGSRPPCVEELHIQAKVNLKTVLRECDKLRKDGFRSSQYYSQGPAFSSPVLSNGVLDQDETENKKKSSESSAEEEKLVYSVGPQTPLLENICDVNNSNSWSKCLPLPTPEEKMRQQAQSVATDIVPINISGESFDRQASFRRTLSNTDTVIRRSKKVKRRKTITGVPDNIQRELAKGQTDRTQSMYMPGQYSTLGHAGSANSTLKHSDTRESGCQTEEMKIVPPSMRRIRAQRGCSIAAQMANISLSSSGCNSNTSNCNGANYSPQHNCSDQGFHSLPRQGSRTILQQHEPKYTSSPYKTINGSTSSLPYQMQQASPAQPMVADPRKNAMISPLSAGFQGGQIGQHHATQDYMVSSHNDSLNQFASNGTLQNFNDFSSIHSAQSFDTVETLQSMPSYPSDHPFSTAGTSISAGSSRCHSPASIHTASQTETESQCSTLNGRHCRSPGSVRRDSDFSESSTQSCSTLTFEQWTYDSAPKGKHTTSSSSPISHVYTSLEHSPTKTDSSSVFSIDTEGYYTSMHMDSGVKSYSHGCINKAGNARHNLYECREHHSQGDRASLHSNQSLTHSISLRKAKKPPLPPKRTDSLRRKPQRKPHHSETALNEKLISSLQESLKSTSASFSGQVPSNGFEDPWVLRPRSESTVSAASSGMSAPAAVCPVTPTHSDSSSSQRSEYAESWDFYMEVPRSQSEQCPSSPNARSASAKHDARGFTNVSTNCSSRRLQLNLATSPDKVHQMTSPSSGYSSQSITPTAGTPVTSLLRAKSPAGRPKPKVPERKSSLRSSVSSSTTSLSSNTSDSFKNLPTPPPLPINLPGLHTLQAVQSVPASPVYSSATRPKIPPTPPTPPPLPIHSIPEKKQISPPVSPTFVECKASFSSTFPGFPPPPSEISDALLMMENTIESPSSSPPPTLPPPPPPPPLPLPPTLPSWVQTPATLPSLHGIGLHAETILNMKSSLISVESVDGEKDDANINQPLKRPPRPLITAQALQLVQLRPIKLMKLENIFTDIITNVCREETERFQEPQTSSEISTEVETPDSPTSESSEEDFKGPCDPTSALLKPMNQNQFGQKVQEVLLDFEAERLSPTLSLQQSTALPVALQSTSPKQKPPISPKKPGLSLIMPQLLHQPLLNSFESVEGPGLEVSTLEAEAQNSTPQRDLVNLQDIPLQLEAEVESNSGNSTPVDPSRVSLSSEFSSDSLNEPHFTALIFNEYDLGLSDTDLGLSDKDLGLSDEKGLSDDSSSSSSGSISLKEDEHEENGAVFDSSTDISSPTSSTNEEAIEEMVTPARPRTTEDLFAAIHRSKRKVLGRGDSEEDRAHGFHTSPPVTPTGASPGLPSLPRQSGFIQRSLRRSATSNNNFKALLLKKGSRSDHGFRMSAAEMLKCTDPRLQRPNGEASSIDDLCTSPGRSRRASEEWARAEGALPRLSPSTTFSRYGRSSTPPSAASSRYNSRSRIPSGPMTVICEKEGELAESMDCSLTAEISYPMSLNSSGTVCPQGST
ncbi:NHS-like protein 1 isoform X2 [Hoplias malabaricus]|uniref:NHS-like protein 1 isoform X2 n=1 Tax=Hoplias malabaricus TaxID=27720 RepID=UPI0034633C81